MLYGRAFEAEYVVQIGDVSNDGAVLNLDVGLINIIRENPRSRRVLPIVNW